VCTWVSVTLNGGVTVTRGATVSVEPVTATLPVVPGSVHSGVPLPSGAAVGQAVSAVAGSAALGVDASLMAGALIEAEDVLADGLFVSELQAASAATADAAQIESATREDIPKKFTSSRYSPRCAIFAISPRWGIERPVFPLRPLGYMLCGHCVGSQRWIVTKGGHGQLGSTATRAKPGDESPATGLDSAGVVLARGDPGLHRDRDDRRPPGVASIQRVDSRRRCRSHRPRGSTLGELADDEACDRTRVEAGNVKVS
jgi:hypothetical protein